MNENPITNRLIDCIKRLSDSAVKLLLTLATDMVGTESTSVTICPYCGSSHFVRNGKKCGKQRFLCRACSRTFVTTTNTILSMSHSPASVWKKVISDTLQGNAIDYTADQLGLSHTCIFNMRHKFLLALQDIIVENPVILKQVSELDETYVLECLKGKQLPPEAGRCARKHGAKAQKRGISNEYVCINTGVSRDGGAIAETVNRAKPDSSELQEVYDGHIQDGLLALCDGLRSYNVLKSIAKCSIKDINTVTGDEKAFYHLNTVNNFHSFIKNRYVFYRGVATKYLNRYNTLFTVAWRHDDSVFTGLCSKLFCPGKTNYHYRNCDVRELRLLVI